MDVFSVQLSDEAVVTGLHSPFLASSRPKHSPLVVAIHGGSYSAHYYVATPSNSVLPISNSLLVPCIAINRPGYLDSTALPPVPENSTYCQEEGGYLHNEILPAIWKIYGEAYGVSSIVVLAHSLSAPMTIVAAAAHAREGSKSYPLAGIILSGFGAQVNATTEASIHPLIDPSSPHIRFPTPLKNEIMLCGLADPDVLAQSERLNTSASKAEFFDGCGTWATYWRKQYAPYFKCPVMYNKAGEDKLWIVNTETVQEFAGAFTESRRVDKGIVVGAPHCMELGIAGRGWYARCFGWAVEVGMAVGVDQGLSG
ncbi:MAG: hypothetical protein LQ346_001953 [Caloplaca aetnensis]|nr:MAG: hypothetical protein LQ346_001953 [Caloplaca aetnensis]